MPGDHYFHTPGDIFVSSLIFAGPILCLTEGMVRPILMCRKAERLRKETGDDRYWAPFERKKDTLGQHIRRVLGRPFLVLAREPMLIAITLYMSVSPVLCPFSCLT